MCGRFPQSQPVIQYANALDSKWGPLPLEHKPTWNLAPSRRAIVLIDADKGYEALLMDWGFLPSWADPKSQKPINARIETAATKPYFRKAWKSGRCLIPADGWYEWKESAKGKLPHFIYRADNQPVLMAGLFETNPHVDITSFAILTTEADGTLRQVHDRKPLVLSSESGQQWIRNDLPVEEISSLAHAPLCANNFTWHIVSTKVNNTKNDGAELIIKSE